MSWCTKIANVNENEWKHVCFGSAQIECPPQTLDNAIMETRPLPTKQSSQAPALGEMANRPNELAQKRTSPF